MLPTSDSGWLSFFNQAYMLCTAGALIFGILALGVSRLQQKYSDRISEAQRVQIEEAAVEIARARENAAKALETAESERLERVRIEQSLAPRRLSEAERVKIADRLSSHRGQLVTFYHQSSDHEAKVFATEIALALKSAGWQVYAPAGIMTATVVGATEIAMPTTPGVMLSPTRDQKAQAAAADLVDALHSRGFDASVGSPDTVSSSRVAVYVEVRPLGPQGEGKLSLSR